MTDRIYAVPNQLGLPEDPHDPPILSVPELLDLEYPPMLIEDVVPRTGVVVVYGDSNSGKTFLMVDMAARVARGMEWAGRKVVMKPVVYVSAEGGAPDMQSRIRAWMQHHDVSPAELDMHFRLEAVNLFEGHPRLWWSRTGELQRFIKSVEGLAPGLVVIDTLAQSMVGGDENSAKDMGLVMSSALAISRRLDAAVVLVHHKPKSRGQDERGSGALRGAVDVSAELVAGKDRHSRLLSCRKMRMRGQFNPVPIKVHAVADSLVFTAGADGPSQEDYVKIRNILRAHPPGMTQNELTKALHMNADRGRRLVVAAANDPSSGIVMNEKGNARVFSLVN